MKPLKLNIEGFPMDYNFYNDQFPPLDALTYWHFLQKAKRVIEVGCGYSTHLSWKSKAECTLIDPQPRVFSIDVPYILKPVQEVDISVFNQLKSDDILFIDSSHIYSKGSDVEYLIEKIIPTLKKGVVIHFHDYFGEHGYPEAWINHPEMKDWNENEYVMKIVPNFTILANNYEISLNHNEELKTEYPFVPQNITQNLGAVRGASIWLKNK